MSESSEQSRSYNVNELKALERLARETSSEKRRELMSRLADLLTEDLDARSDETVELLTHTLIDLLDQVEEPGRIELSERVAPNETTPRPLVRKLAGDQSARVAEPVLERSPVLTDDDLVAIAGEKSQKHLMAMSRRQQLSARVTDAIIDNGTTPVFEAVASNSGAEISAPGFSRLAAEAPSNDGLAEALSHRTDIPEAVAEEVIACLPPKHRLRLEALWSAHSARSEALFEEAAREMGEARLARRRGQLEAKVAVKAIRNGTRSLEGVICHFAGSNRLGETAHVIAAMANVPEKYVRAALFRVNSTIIAVVCRSIGLSDKAFEEITRMRCSQLGLPANDGNQLLQAFRSLDVDSASRTVRFAAARLAADRRSGLDTRPPQEREQVGERRSGEDRRALPRGISA